MIETIAAAFVRREIAARLIALAASLVVLVLIGVTVLLVILAGGGAQQAAEAAAESDCDPFTDGSTRWVNLEPIENLTKEQTDNAATIASVAEQLGVPEYGVIVAIAVAWQEARLINVDHGDRDSLGLFQQRPSQGWGTPGQVTDPVLAARAFFGRASHTQNTGLLDVNGWEAMTVGEAGQAVQRSADPTGSWYAQHEPLARQVVARLLSGVDGLGTGSVARVGHQQEEEEVGPYRVRVVHANSPDWSADIRGSLKRVVARAPDFVSLNETRNRSRREFTPAGYASWRAGPVQTGRRTAEASGTAVLWRKDRWQRVDAGRIEIVNSGPQKWDQRFAQWVTVEGHDEGLVSMIAVHHVINPAKHDPNRPPGQRLYRQGMLRLRDLVRTLSTRGPVFLAGDMNSQFAANDAWGPRTMLARAGMTSTMDVLGRTVTHVSGRSIDYVFFETARAEPLRQWAQPIAGEHRLIGADFRVLGGVTGSLGTRGAGLMCGTGRAMDCPQTPWSELESGLTPDALRVVRCLAQQFPLIESWAGVGERPSNPGSSHETGRAVDAMIPRWNTAAGQAFGDQVADWVRRHAAELGVRYIIWDARIWSVERADEGWRPYEHPSGASDPTSLHRDHVHVDVFGDSAGTQAVSGPWTAPIGGSHVVTAEFGECSSLWADCHTGLDLAAPAGTPVAAAASGTVVSAGNGGPYGNLVKIDHGGGVQTWYAHLNSMNVRPGTVVRRGTVIGEVGSTGNSTGPHLHFEVRNQGVPVDPARFLEDRGVMA